MPLISNVFAKTICRIQKIKYGKGMNCYGFPIIAKSGSGRIEIGSELVLRSSFLSNMIGLYQRNVIVARASATVKIGNNVGMSGATVYARDSIIIGDNVLVGANTKIVDNDFHPIDPQKRRENSPEIGKRPVVIGNDVFIGCNCLILKGANIGEGAVIGAGSVVTGEIPAFCVAAGNPAKVVKTLEVAHN